MHTLLHFRNIISNIWNNGIQCAQSDSLDVIVSSTPASNSRWEVGTVGTSQSRVHIHPLQRSVRQNILKRSTSKVVGPFIYGVRHHFWWRFCILEWILLYFMTEYRLWTDAKAMGISTDTAEAMTGHLSMICSGFRCFEARQPQRNHVERGKCR